MDSAKLYPLTILFLLCLLIPSLSNSTNVSGQVTGTWDQAGSPFYVVGTITVPMNCTLTIDPGVEVIFQGWYRFIIQGRIQAIGTQTDSITITATDTLLGWEGFRIENIDMQRDSSKLVYCLISYAKSSCSNSAIVDKHGGAVYCSYSSKLLIEHCSFISNRTGTIVGIAGNPGSSFISPYAGSAGESVNSGSGGAIYLSNSNPMIICNLFKNNRTGNATGGNGGSGASNINMGAAVLGGDGGAGGSGTSGSGGAIFCLNSQPVLIDNQFIQNYTGEGRGGLGGNGGDAIDYGSCYIAQAGDGAQGGNGLGGDGGAVCYSTSNALISNSLFVGNITGLAQGGAGGHGGVADLNWENEGEPGYGGDGGIGHAGNASGICCQTRSIQIQSCTFHLNRCGTGVGGSGGVGGSWGHNGSNGWGINGLYVLHYATSCTVQNSIFTSCDTIIVNGAAATIEYSNISHGWPGNGNINADPLYVSGPSGDYYLSQLVAGQSEQSPCVNSGNPLSTMIIGTTRTDGFQDLGIIDMGFHYPMENPLPILLNLGTTAINPPIVIPANGGSFNYEIDCENLGQHPTSFQVWNLIRDEMGESTLVFGPHTYDLDGNAHPQRTWTQSLAGSLNPGELYFISFVGSYPNTIADSSFFTITKSTVTDGGPWISESYVSGDIFNEFAAETTIPNVCSLSQNYPNPFNPTTQISFNLPQASFVKLTIFDVAGREVATLINGMRDAGPHEITFDGSGLASGIYLCRLQATPSGSGATPTTMVQKMVLLK
jgi:hypothetical protein